MTALLDIPLRRVNPRVHPLPGAVSAAPAPDSLVDRLSGVVPTAPASAQGLGLVGSAQTFAALPPAFLPPVRPAVIGPSRLGAQLRAGTTMTPAVGLSRECGSRQAIACDVALAPLRLTRRARLLLTAVTVLGLLSVMSIAALNADAGRGGLQDAPASVVVQDGDTLWQIAAEVAPAEDPSAVVALLRSANDLDASALQPGQILVVPPG